MNTVWTWVDAPLFIPFPVSAHHLVVNFLPMIPRDTPHPFCILRMHV